MLCKLSIEFKLYMRMLFELLMLKLICILQKICNNMPLHKKAKPCIEVTLRRALQERSEQGNTNKTSI